MVEVQFLGPIGRQSIQIEAHTVAELGELLAQDEQVALWLRECAVAVNDEIITDVGHLLRSGDVVCILPPVCGG